MVLRDHELKYNILDKQAYALIKLVKDFRVFILYFHVISYVPDVAIKSILIHSYIDGRRGTWIANILEINLEIKPTKLVKAQGLARLITETNLDTFCVIRIWNYQIFQIKNQWLKKKLVSKNVCGMLILFTFYKIYKHHQGWIRLELDF